MFFLFLISLFFTILSSNAMYDFKVFRRDGSISDQVIVYRPGFIKDPDAAGLVKVKLDDPAYTIYENLDETTLELQVVIIPSEPKDLSMLKTANFDGWRRTICFTNETQISYEGTCSMSDHLEIRSRRSSHGSSHSIIESTHSIESTFADPVADEANARAHNPFSHPPTDSSIAPEVTPTSLQEPNDIDCWTAFILKIKGCCSCCKKNA